MALSTQTLVLMNNLRKDIPGLSRLSLPSLVALAEWIEEDRRGHSAAVDERLTDLRKTLVEISQLHFARPQAD